MSTKTPPVSPFGNAVLLICIQNIPRADQRRAQWKELDSHTLGMCVDAAAHVARIFFVMRQENITPGAGIFCEGERQVVIEALALAVVKRERPVSTPEEKQAVAEAQAAMPMVLARVTRGDTQRLQPE